MANQLNLLSTGQVITTALHTEMQRSYLEYAMSVIVGRALPDVRDGLKPVHRRILYAMHELGLTPDRPYRKCARVVGDVLGKYHPHGDQSVYDALVRLVQDFSSRYPLLAGHGNFGSVDNDPPAAMRYTETRLASISHEGMLTEIGEETVEFVGNFDNSQQEPTVLPAQLPYLILNGCAGIAVGMATNIPPHNLNEVVDGLVALIDNPELSDEKLFGLIPAPDFPTGGEIVGNSAGIKEAYTTGRGSIVLRGIANIEEIPASRSTKRRMAIIITELPYQVNKAGWIEKVAELVNQGRLNGISDIRDESDRDGIRVVIELKRDTNPQEILQHLYHQTALQTNFGAILLAIVDGQPRQLSLRNLLLEFLSFREQTLLRRYNYELSKAENRLNLVSGLLKALASLDEVISILRQAPDGSTAKVNLINQLELSEVQADAILSMPLRRLTGLEQQNLQQEFRELSEQIGTLQKLLGDRKELLKSLKKDLRNLKRKFGDERRTKIVTEEQRSKEGEQKSKGAAEDEDKSKSLQIKPDAPIEDTILEVTYRGYVRRNQPNGKKSKADNATADNDFILQTSQTDTDKDLLVITSGAKVYPIRVGDIPLATGRNTRGTPLITLLSSTAQGTTEAILSRFLLPENPEDAQMILLTKQGRIKRLPLVELTNLTRRGITVTKLKEDDELLSTSFVTNGNQIILASSGGRLLRFTVKDEQLPLMGRTAMGVQGMRLRLNETMAGCTTFNNAENILIVTEQGYAKRMAINNLRVANRGDIGIQCCKFTNKTDALAGIACSVPNTEVALVTNQQRVVRLGVETVPLLGRDRTGENILQLNRDEKIITVIELRE